VAIAHAVLRRQAERVEQLEQQHQQEMLQLKRSLAAAQSRKDSAEAKARALKQESKALSVALKTVAKHVVHQSEQKAELRCSAQMVLHQAAAPQQQLLCTSGQQLLASDQQPPTPSCSSRHSVLEAEDTAGRSINRAATDQVRQPACCCQRTHKPTCCTKEGEVLGPACLSSKGYTTQ
jgi:chromosome segregation ATPase